MGLRSLNFKNFYRTNSDNVVDDFLIPALQNAIKYDRAVGFFTTSGLLSLSPGIISLIKHGGFIRVIASPLLTIDDFEAIQNGYSIDEIVLERLISELENVDDMVDRSKLDIISNLIASKHMSIKIAFSPRGIYHEKICIITDLDGDYVTFNGSMNETYSAFYNNMESIDVFLSWKEHIDQYANQHLLSFEEIWHDTAKNISVIDFPDAVENKLFDKYKLSETTDEAIQKYQSLSQNSDKNSVPPSVEKELYPFQTLAIEEFKSNNHRHFFEMATGTGKTFTAVHAIKELIQNVSNSFTIILVPLIDLQEQWIHELEDAGFSNIQRIGGTKSPTNWSYHFNQNLLDYVEGTDSHIIYVAVYDSFFSKLVNQLKNIKNLFIIADEAHNLSVNQLKKMPENALYRLGLSATPEKHDEAETENILSYFLPENKVSYKYTIEDAIDAGFLSRYYYYPIFTYLNDDEFSRYIDYSKKIAILQNIDPIDKDALGAALRDRSLIIKKAENKIVKLIEMISSSDYDFTNSVVYCGQGKYGNTDQSLIEVVTRAFGDSKYVVSTYTSQTENRDVVLDEFKNNFFDVLVAIKCFDEGIDVPQLDKIYIMSSDRLKRQTVQRRGRVLRICKETGKQFAYIYDMVVFPPRNYGDLNSAHNLIQNELYRVNEYNKLAENNLENSTLISKFIAENHSLDLSVIGIPENEMEDDINECCR